MPRIRSHLACLLACVAAAALGAGCRPKSTGKSPSPAGDASGGGGGILGGAVRPGGAEGAGGTRPFSLRVDSQNRLRQIGLAYQQAALLGDKVTGPEALGRETQMKDPSGQPYEVVWNVDPGKLGGRGAQLLLAWEEVPDKEGGRCVLMADCTTVGYLRADEFERAQKATPNR
jgi:hypothetical protein